MKKVKLIIEQQLPLSDMEEQDGDQLPHQDPKGRRIARGGTERQGDELLPDDRGFEPRLNVKIVRFSLSEILYNRKNT